jgi:hypothetical protein
LVNPSEAICYVYFWADFVELGVIYSELLKKVKNTAKLSAKMNIRCATVSILDTVNSFTHK